MSDIYGVDHQPSPDSEKTTVITMQNVSVWLNSLLFGFQIYNSCVFHLRNMRSAFDRNHILSYFVCTRHSLLVLLVWAVMKQGNKLDLASTNSWHCDWVARGPWQPAAWLCSRVCGWIRIEHYMVLNLFDLKIPENTKYTTFGFPGMNNFHVHPTCASTARLQCVFVTFAFVFGWNIVLKLQPLWGAGRVPEQPKERHWPTLEFRVKWRSAGEFAMSVGEGHWSRQTSIGQGRELWFFLYSWEDDGSPVVFGVILPHPWTTPLCPSHVPLAERARCAKSSTFPKQMTMMLAHSKKQRC